MYSEIATFLPMKELLCKKVAISLYTIPMLGINHYFKILKYNHSFSFLGHLPVYIEFLEVLITVILVVL